MSWCLLKSEADKFRKALKDGTISPEQLAQFKSSVERRNFLAKFVGEENAQQINALYESKLLLKNQKAGMISWAKKVVGITPKTRTDLISRIERLDKVLNPKEEEVFLQDLASTRLGVDINQEQAKQISDMAEKRAELKAKIPENSPIRSKERLEYGVADALLKEHMAKLKYDANKISFREQPARYALDVALNAIPNLSQSIRTAFDNSYWLRQGNSLLFNPKYSKIWVKNFAKSWKNMAIALKGQDPMIAIKADVYSRPNALDGTYDADPNGYGLGVKSEEVYSSDIPSKIPGLSRLYNASQAMFNGGALQSRADVADLEIELAKKVGLNTKDKETASAISSMVTSLTGRGSVGGAEGVLRKIFWAPRMYAGQLNQLTAHIFDPKATSYVRKKAAINLVSMAGVYATIFAIAKLFDPDSVDPKEHLGKIKIWGKWVDITGGKASYISLVNKMADAMIKGYKGEKYAFGERNAWEELASFAEGKLSPNAGIMRDILSASLFGGKPMTLGSAIKEYFLPISAGTLEDLIGDPTASNIIGLMLLESIGANVSTWLDSNEKTNIIPTKTKMEKKNFISMALVYADAFGTDPVDALNKVFKNENIIQVSDGGIIVVERMSVDESQAFKKKWVQEHGGRVEDMKLMKLDHTIPVKLGGTNTEDNLKMVLNADWERWTPMENTLIQAVKDDKISKKDAKDLVIKVKSSSVDQQKAMIKDIISKYK